jgi:hypothetical protein
MNLTFFTPARLEQFKDAPNLRVLVGGGDGTYHYVIQAMIEAGICPLPPVPAPLWRPSWCVACECCACTGLTSMV